MPLVWQQIPPAFEAFHLECVVVVTTDLHDVF